MNKISKPRRHFCLFDNKLPFKHREELSKVLYSRKIKHKGNKND